MKGGEPVSLGAHLGEEKGFQELWVRLRRDADGLEDDARAGQLRVEAHRFDLGAAHGDSSGDALQSLSGSGSISTFELRELGNVQSADVCAPPLLVDAARHGHALERVERSAPALQQPVGFAVEGGDLLHASKSEGHA